MPAASSSCSAWVYSPEGVLAMPAASSSYSALGHSSVTATGVAE